MINLERATSTLKKRYPQLQQVGDRVFRGVDIHDGHPYAIRYFDLNDELPTSPSHLKDYQESLLGSEYFAPEADTDLRWNHYLYFVVSRDRSASSDYLKARAAIESNREYARKLVVNEVELEAMSLQHVVTTHTDAAFPPDPLSIWSSVLEQHSLGFVFDDDLEVPEVVRQIESGKPLGRRRLPSPPILDLAEQLVSKAFVSRLNISGFRKYPVQQEFDFGHVNLIIGPNGVGKTSLLEAIEYVFCGKTRRGGKVPSRAIVAAALNGANNNVLTTKGSTPAERFRARHLAWYGKADLKKITLDDSFAKFNFLDTDAAVRLTVDESKERLMDDLTHLLLGAEAVKALDRFARVQKQLLAVHKTAKNDIAMWDLRSSEARKRANLLIESPKLSDQLFHELLNTLRQVGWSTLPKEKEQAIQLSETFQECLVSVDILVALPPGLPRNVTELGTLSKNLDAALQEVKANLNRSIQINGEIKTHKSELDELSKRQVALEGLNAFATASIEDATNRLNELQQVIAKQSTLLSDVNTDVALDDETLSRPVATVISSAANRVAELQDQVNAARKSVAALDRGQTALKTLRQKLMSAVHDVLSHTGDSTHCPVCRTKFSKGELAKIIDESIREVEDLESSRIRKQLADSETALQHATAAAQTAEAFAKLTENPGRQTMAQTVAIAQEMRKTIDTAEKEVHGLQQQISTLATKGFTAVRLRQLKTEAGISDVLSTTLLEKLKEQVVTQRKSTETLLKPLETELQSNSQKASELGKVWQIETTSMSEMISAFEKRRRELTDLRAALTALSGNVKIDSSASALDLQKRLKLASEVLSRLQTASKKERTESTQMEKELQQENDAKDTLAGLRVREKNIQAALNIIDELLQEHSDRALTAQVLRDNSAQIAATFAKIHAPNEFDVEVNGHLRILRRTDKSDVTLDEMSSGQRSAYALSLFLAMNHRLQNGPKVLLFDDPVAHVDDINTLSFLDYLRDLALNGSRQIFFATADSKLAGLFRHKFRFLGNERFKQFELARTD